MCKISAATYIYGIEKNAVVNLKKLIVFECLFNYIKPLTLKINLDIIQ